MAERVSVAGTGFVGLVTAACFASRGIPVTASNFINKRVEESVRQGIPHFYEKDLENLLKQGIRSKMLKIVTDLEDAIAETSITYITEGTPMLPDKSIDLQYVEKAASQIGRGIREKKERHLVVVKSTVVPGTTSNLVGSIIEEISGKRREKDFGLCMNPEFLREGSAVYDTFNPDRIVIGELSRDDGDRLAALYRLFYGEKSPTIIRMSIETAEIVKYAANTFLATKISFANEIASLCERIPGVDVKQVFEAVGLDFRINPRFLNAGAGFGGSCFPKDLNAIIAYAKKLSIKPIILESVVERNNLQSRKIAETVRDVLGDLNNKRIAILGLAFKPETDDLREAASIRIINHLKAIGAGAIVGYDPQAMGAARELLEDKIEYASSVYECIKNADACIIVTEWEEFRKLSPSDFVAQMRTPVLIDARRIYDPKLFAEKMTFRAIGLGEPKIETKNL